MSLEKEKPTTDSSIRKIYIVTQTYTMMSAVRLCTLRFFTL
jgi:hypothetical protein